MNIAAARRQFSSDTTRYTSDHEYLTKLDDGTFQIGITQFAANELGDVVYVELPAVGDTFDAEEAFASVESVKAAESVYAPTTLEITEINERLADEPDLINQDPLNDGFMIKAKIADESSLDDLMDAAAYSEHTGE
jgi:glycine cleavage system H protein